MGEGVPGGGDRERLVAADHKVTQDFDKAILAIGAGTLAVSVAFLTDIAADPPIDITVLVVSWICLAGSMLAVMVSTYTSHWALVKAIADLDRQKAGRLRGGCFTWATEMLNLLALVMLLVGVVGVLVFAYLNLAT